MIFLRVNYRQESDANTVEASVMANADSEKDHGSNNHQQCCGQSISAQRCAQPNCTLL